MGKTYRLGITNQLRRLINKVGREKRVSVVHDILQLVDVLAGQQILQVLGGVPAQQRCAAFHDGLQVVDGVLTKEVFDTVEDGREV